jgi:transcriptional regulator with XRE-family HTH domain
MKTKDLIDLRAVRQAAGLSQAELGALVKMEQPYVSSLETGAKPMSVNSSKRLGAPLGADSTILFVCNRMRAIGAWRREHQRPDQKPRPEVMPENAFAYQGFEGLAFDQVKQQMERPLRVAIAHGSNIRDGRPITAASAEDLMLVSYVVPVIRYMAQVTLENVRTTLASTERSSRT